MWIQFLRLWKAFENKKNWLFFGAADAGERSAVIYRLSNPADAMA